MNIYVTDTLNAKIEKWREQLNCSEIFAEAINTKIGLLERLQRVCDKDAKIIERLRQDADVDYQKGLADGIDCGIEWAEEFASLKDLRLIVNGISVNNILPREDDFHALNVFEANSDYDFESWQNGYSDGFSKGTRSVWNCIDGRL